MHLRIRIPRSLAAFDAFYTAKPNLFEEITRQPSRFVVFDLHSYNHRRNGVEGLHADVEGHPQVDIGTGAMNHERWAPVVDTFIDTLRSFDFPGGKLDVRENVKFFGGAWPRWIHETFAGAAVVISIKFKNFFMDEWAGDPDDDCIRAIGQAWRFTVPAVLEALKQICPCKTTWQWQKSLILPTRRKS